MTRRRFVRPGPSSAAPRRAAAALMLLLAFGILVTIWLTARWGLSVFQTGLFVLAAGWIVHMLRHSLPFARGVCLYALAGTVAWGLLQLALDSTVYRAETWEAVLAWTTNLTGCFLALQLFTDDKARRSFLRWVVYFGFALGVLGTVQAYTSAGAVYWIFPSGYSDQIFGPFLSANQYAAFLMSIIPIAIVEALKSRRRAAVLMSAAGVMVASVVASGSRAGMVLVIFEIAATLLLALRWGLVARRTVLTGFGWLLAVSLLAAVVVGWTGLWRRFQEADPFVVRRDLVQATVAMIRDRPWLGSGLGTWTTAYPAYARYDDGRFVNQAHNDWLQWTAEGGVPFVLLMLTVAVWTIPPAVRSRWGVGLLAVFAHAWVDYPMQQRPALAAWFFVLIGVLAAQQQASVAVRQSGAPPSSVPN